MSAGLVERGEGYALQIDSSASAVLSNDLDRYAEAFAAAQEVAYELSFLAPFTLSEVSEAAVRCGRPELAGDVL